VSSYKQFLVRLMYHDPIDCISMRIGAKLGVGK
jgi:hypothetical protein